VTWVQVHGVPGLEEWHVEAHLAESPDGGFVLTGIHLDPLYGHPVDQQALAAAWSELPVDDLTAKAVKTLLKITKGERYPPEPEGSPRRVLVARIPRGL
jgi:hypothetical protein